MRRLSSAADARAYLEQQAEAEGGLVLPLEEGWEWLTTYRQRTKGLPFLQLLADDLAHALARGELEYVGVVFSPPQAEVPEGLLIWGTLAAPGGSYSRGTLQAALPSDGRGRPACSPTATSSLALGLALERRYPLLEQDCLAQAQQLVEDGAGGSQLDALRICL